MIEKGLDSLIHYLREQKLISDSIFIDGTKLLADANKYSFVWEKSTIKYDKMNREQIVSLMFELKEAHLASRIPEGTSLTLDRLDEVLTRLELRLEDLEQEVIQTKDVSPNPAKQQRRTLKAQKRKLSERRDKMADHQQRLAICGIRNSYSKTDTDATFMRVKEDSMRNGQLKPAFNLQIATSNQFILNYDVYQNPTDTRTFPTFIEKMNKAGRLPRYIVADAGYGSEQNYRYLEEERSNHTALIPYSTMLKEQSKKWQSDERKIMNWTYNEKEEYYFDPKGVQFNFNTYRTDTDKADGFVRDFKEYKAEKYTENKEVIQEALTQGGNTRIIKVNSSLEYFKAKQRTLLLEPENGKIYAQRKIDVEPVFGWMKACLHFTRYHVLGMEKVKKETGILILALNMRKLAAMKRLGTLNT